MACAKHVFPALLVSRSLQKTVLRQKGHAHWQNVMKSKLAGDKLRAAITSTYCNRIKVVVRDYGADPSLNPQLERLISDASKNDVPKDTINRTIQNALTKPVQTFFVSYKGPGGSFFIAEALTDNKNALQFNINGRLKKVPGGFTSNDKTAESYFEHVGMVRILRDSAPPPSPQQERGERAWNAPPQIPYPPPLTFEQAETLAIELNALHVAEIQDEEGRPAFEILCEPSHVKRLEKELTSKHYALVGCGQEFRPLCRVRLSAQHAQYVDQFYDALEGVDELQNIFDNVEYPEDQ